MTDTFPAKPLQQGDTSRDIYSVTRLVSEARAVLEASFPVLWVHGEVSNLARPGSGHLYFTLKDARCQVRCAMFRSRNVQLGFQPTDGIQVLVQARVSLYEGRGDFQLIVEHMEPAGEGALRLAFEQLKRRLAAEGLFAEAHKQPLPAFPGCVGVVTSPTGAAIRDILHVFQRRFPALPVIVYPVQVQGGGAGPAIARMIAKADARKDCDVLLLARGGGSLEDLWPFNEEQVARAIFHCVLPVVSAVGHEVDFTIADFVADVRAPTPSAGAELVSPDGVALQQRVKRFEALLAFRIQEVLVRAEMALTALGKRLTHPGRRLEQLAQRVDDVFLRMTAIQQTLIETKRARLAGACAGLQRNTPTLKIQQLGSRYERLGERCRAAFERQLAHFEARLSGLARALDAVTPLATLHRGYAIVTKLPQGVIVRGSEQLAPGDTVSARFASGKAVCQVQECISQDQDPS